MQHVVLILLLFFCWYNDRDLFLTVTSESHAIVLRSDLSAKVCRLFFFFFLFFFWLEGNIQGGGQTFPGQFKRHYGSQIFESTKQVHTDLANDAKICNKSELDYSLKNVSRSAWLIVLPTSALKKLACRFWKTRSWSNVRCTLKNKICWSSPFVSNLGFIRLIIDKDMTLWMILMILVT